MDYSYLFNYTELLIHDWDKLSSGMKAYLNLFSNIYSNVSKVNSSNIVICIDEGDLYFHPEMQRNFLDDLLQFINQQFENKSVQLILTSHSPFLVADLPNSNLILLKIDETTKTMVIDEENNKSRTFASNIYKLFNNQLFLENGSLGAFSMRKLNEILELSKNTNLESDDINKYRIITSLIGDEMIRMKMEEHLVKQNSKFSSSNKEVLKNWYLEMYKQMGGTI